MLGHVHTPVSHLPYGNDGSWHISVSNSAKCRRGQLLATQQLSFISSGNQDYHIIVLLLLLCMLLWNRWWMSCEKAMSQFGNPCFKTEQQLVNCSAIPKINSGLWQTIAGSGAAPYGLWRSPARRFALQCCPPIYCAMIATAKSAHSYLSSALSRQSGWTLTHTFLEHEEYSTFQSWQLAPSSPQSQVKYIRQ